MLLTALNSLSPVLLASMDTRYSTAWRAAAGESLQLRTRRHPETHITSGLLKWRTAFSTISLSKEVSPSMAMITSPVERAKPELREETRPPLFHLGRHFSTLPGREFTSFSIS